ncbi:hypothetical protein A3F66_00570 [candidate division TM6 bacterium RIFCSPHIGHO2_12_FULL_32_22]|nr:MAG: hypothetical protein A3F66_00570 [candidate division TM6 bacterium RIFCSPHIGHO2_12_FULL_32_22]
MVIKYRNLAFVILMSIFTLGIYWLYWLVKTKDEINSLGGDVPTAWLIIIPIANIYFWYKYANGFVAYVEKQPENNTLVLLYTLCFMFLPILNVVIIQTKLNSMATVR